MNLYVPSRLMTKYAFLDGDNIGNAINNLFSNGRIKEAQGVSESIKSALFKIERFVHSTPGVDLIIAGGDDIFVKYESGKHGLELIEKIADMFYQQTGLTMSYGVGETVEESISNLIIKKQQNKGVIGVSEMEGESQKRRITETRLYVFKTSEIPDPYINVIAHCEAFYPNITQIILIGIVVDRGKIGLEKDSLSKLKERIAEQLDNLSEAKYATQKDDEQEIIEVQMEQADRRRYSKLKDLKIEIQPIFYGELEKEISGFLNASESCAYIFDVTSMTALLC